MKPNTPAESRSPNQNLPSQSEEPNIQINGLEQIIEMLRHADPAFRNSLLKRLQARDPGLARKLARVIQSY